MPYFERLPNGTAGAPKDRIDLRHLPASGFVPKVTFQVLDGFVYVEPGSGVLHDVAPHNAELPPEGGNSTDLASVPPMMWGVVASFGLHTMPAVVHDKLCVDAASRDTRSERLQARADADRVFRVALQEAGVPWAKRWVMWAAVRIFGVVSLDRARGIALVLAMLATWLGVYLVAAPDEWWPALDIGGVLVPVVAAVPFVAAALLGEVGRAVAIGGIALPLVAIAFINLLGLVALWLLPFLTWLARKAASVFGGSDPGGVPPIGPTRV